jgi:hypothetical protein
MSTTAQASTTRGIHPLLRKACELEVKKVRALFRRKHQDFLDFCTKHPRTSAALMPLLELNGATCGVCFRLPDGQPSGWACCRRPPGNSRRPLPILLASR